MGKAELKFFKNCAEQLTKERIKDIPNNTRGIYVLLNKNKKYFNVVYIGMARGEKTGAHSRLNVHAKSKRKANKWSHFSIFEVHDNISTEEIEELEGLIRHIYRFDQKANEINVQKRHHKLFKIRNNDFKKWK